jgi:Ca-activated chloride channel family protein
MKPTHLIVWSSVGMIATGASVYAMTPDGGLGRTRSESGETVASVASASESAAPLVGGTGDPDHATFVKEGTVRIDARLGNARLVSGTTAQETVMLELRGSEADALAPTVPVHLGLVVDRSGSMHGKRIENAKAASIAAVDRLADGDTVSVVAFDTSALTVVPPTRLDPSTRDGVKQKIQALSLGGDTCISCGIDAAEAFMESTPEHVRRLIVLSDGDTNAGVRDVAGMKGLAATVHAHGTTLSSIGVDLSYNEKIMAAIAEGGEGLHHFVAEPSDLARVFADEALSARTTVATGAEVHVRLEPGVELVEALDRSFTRQGSDLVFPLGAFSKGEVKTVILRVRVPAARSAEAGVVGVDVRYRDLAAGKDVATGGALAALLGDTADEIDPFVSARVERSRTATALDHANELFRQGKLDEARKAIAAQKEALEVEQRKSPPSGGGARPGPSRLKDAEDDVNRQLGSLSRAENGFATPPPSEPAAPAAKKPSIARPDPFEANAKQNQVDSTFSRR